MLRHALDIGYVATGIQLHVEATPRRPARSPPSAASRSSSTSRSPRPTRAARGSTSTGPPSAITGDPHLPLGVHPDVLTPRNPYLGTQIDARRAACRTRPRRAGARLRRAHRPVHQPARRLVAADCSVRPIGADAWRRGRRRRRRRTGRRRPAGALPRRLRLGRRSATRTRRLTPVELPPELAAIFNRPGEPPLMRDSTNFGYIHAPSLDHAVTAAMLRNGYLANATPATRTRWRSTCRPSGSGPRCDVSTGSATASAWERCSATGSSAGSMTGRPVPRLAHLRAARRSSRWPPTASRTATGAARTRSGGRGAQRRRRPALVEHVAAQPASTTYPYGLADLPCDRRDAPSPAAGAVDTEVEGSSTYHDAIADLAISESVYQVVRGNYDRALRARSTPTARATSRRPPRSSRRRGRA